jgi:hypothetical protein
MNTKQNKILIAFANANFDISFTFKEMDTTNYT